MRKQTKSKDPGFAPQPGPGNLLKNEKNTLGWDHPKLSQTKRLEWIHKKIDE
jgi:hypothetical protein